MEGVPKVDTPPLVLTDFNPKGSIYRQFLFNMNILFTLPLRTTERRYAGTFSISKIVAKSVRDAGEENGEK